MPGYSSAAAERSLLPWSSIDTHTHTHKQPATHGAVFTQTACNTWWGIYTTAWDNGTKRSTCTSITQHAQQIAKRSPQQHAASTFSYRIPTSFDSNIDSRSWNGARQQVAPFLFKVGGGGGGGGGWGGCTCTWFHTTTYKGVKECIWMKKNIKIFFSFPSPLSTLSPRSWPVVHKIAHNLYTKGESVECFDWHCVADNNTRTLQIQVQINAGVAWPLAQHTEREETTNPQD